MFENAGRGIVAVISGILVVAVIAVIVSQNAQTPTLVTDTGSALQSVITAAVSPVAGGSTI
jgi:hypothetical protein